MAASEPFPEADMNRQNHRRSVRRLESAHLPIKLKGRVMQLFCLIVKTLILPMFYPGNDFSFYCSAGFNFVGDIDTGSLA